MDRLCALGTCPLRRETYYCVDDYGVSAVDTRTQREIARVNVGQIVKNSGPHVLIPQRVTVAHRHIVLLESRGALFIPLRKKAARTIEQFTTGQRWSEATYAAFDEKRIIMCGIDESCSLSDRQDVTGSSMLQVWLANHKTPWKHGAGFRVALPCLCDQPLLDAAGKHLHSCSAEFKFHLQVLWGRGVAAISAKHVLFANYTRGGRWRTVEATTREFVQSANEKIVHVASTGNRHENSYFVCTVSFDKKVHRIYQGRTAIQRRRPAAFYSWTFVGEVDFDPFARDGLFADRNLTLLGPGTLFSPTVALMAAMGWIVFVQTYDRTNDGKGWTEVHWFQQDFNGTYNRAQVETFNEALFVSLRVEQTRDSSFVLADGQGKTHTRSLVV